MRKVLLIAGIIAMALTCPVQAQADVLFDTGLGTGYWNLDTNQWLYAKFSLSEPVTMDYAEAYTTAHSQGYNPGYATLVIYGDGGDLPDRSNTLYSEVFSATANSWCGVSGMNLTLATGSYWLGFEVRPGNTFKGGIAGRYSVPNPLYDEAATGSQSGGSSLYAYDALNISVRAGTSEKVPEPATMLLLGLGLMGLTGVRRRFKR